MENFRPTGQSVVQAALALLGTPYAEMDCIALVRRATAAAGGSAPPKGVNTLMRSPSVLWWGTLDNARAQGRLVPGAALLIHQDDGGEPARYRGDGMGNFSHIGLYAGENALTDTDAKGRRRICDVIHSSQSLGRVAGSTLQNGWTHAAWLSEIDCGPSGPFMTPEGTSATSSGPSGPSMTPEGTSALGSSGNPPVDVSTFYTVKQGCLGGAVRRLQGWLIALGYDIGPHGADGRFGPDTRAALLAFQQANHLAADGVAGQRTWAALAQALNQEESE